jgi:hypothetical protein
VIATLHVPFDHELQKSREALIAGEAWTCQDARQLIADGLLPRFYWGHQFENIVFSILCKGF